MSAAAVRAVMLAREVSHSFDTGNDDSDQVARICRVYQSLALNLLRSDIADSA